MKVKKLLIVLGVLILAVLIGAVVLPFLTPKDAGVGYENKYPDLIQIDAPGGNAIVQSPLAVVGTARGQWYFEASFPIELLDANGKQLAEVPVQAKGDWMTTEFVPFEVELTFASPTTKTGTLVLKNDNPSGLPENEKEVRIPVQFSDYKEVNSVEFGKPVTMGVNEKIIFPDGLVLTLNQINDSRCKKGVVCIWAGELSAVFYGSQWKATTAPSQEIRLGTVNNKSVSSGGYTFSLMSATESSATVNVSKTPAANIPSSITGYIHSGPTCPVERIPPDPNCAERAFADAKVDIRIKSSGVLAKSLVSDATGNFRADLIPGAYTITAGPKTGGFLPRCNPVEATVTTGKVVSVDISCDTGIR